MNAIIDDINCRFLAVFEKLGVVFMAQHFNVYSPTMPSDSYKPSRLVSLVASDQKQLEKIT